MSDTNVTFPGAFDNNERLMSGKNQVQHPLVQKDTHPITTQLLLYAHLIVFLRSLLQLAAIHLFSRSYYSRESRNVTISGKSLFRSGFQEFCLSN